MPTDEFTPADHVACALEHHARQRPDALALRFLVTGDVDGERIELTYAGLTEKVTGIIQALRDIGVQKGDRVLLLFEGGPDFLATLLACFRMGAVAVPTYPPDAYRFHRTLPRLQAIVADAGARFVATSLDIQEASKHLCLQVDGLKHLEWIGVDRLSSDAGVWPSERPEPHDIAFLQYTSGSTGTPKGVIVTHDNLKVSCHEMAWLWLRGDNQHQVSWLPTFHDLGLIWGLLTPLVAGIPFTFMPPLAFLQRPLRWLQAIHHYRATLTAAPDFGYALCAARVKDHEVAALDLSCLHAVGNAAEPVRPDTLRAFTQRFAAAGFRAEVMCPGYGLAEAVLQVTMSTPEQGPATVARVDQGALEQGIVRASSAPDEEGYFAVGCGRSAPETEVRIVDCDTRTALPADRVGEIWVHGPLIAAGYWGRPEETAHTFQARITGEEDGRTWLRTGDLGFMREGELFVTGRIKDLIIFRGRNLYPQDLEVVVERVHRAVRPSCVAAFALEHEAEERIGLVAEVDVSRLELEPTLLLENIRRAIIDAFDVLIQQLVLISPRTIPKTSSGKIQRRRTREALLNGELEVVAQWTAPELTPAGAVLEKAEEPSALTLPGLWNLLRSFPGVALPASPMPGATFRDLGFDSRRAVEASGLLGEALNRAFPPTLLFDHPTLSRLHRHLTGGEPHSAPKRSRSRAVHGPIAIVGMSCRFPASAETPEAFWEMLRSSETVLREVPIERWGDVAVSAEYGVPGHMTSRVAGLLEDVDHFDGAFFGVSPREAVTLDPQQRILLELAWEALERAQWSAAALEGSRTGIFVGLSAQDWMARALAEGQTDRIDPWTLTGGMTSVAAGRIAYHLGLQGPTLTVDTACSSALVAVHLAVQSLRMGECDQALAGGVSLLLSPQPSIALSQMGALSPAGRCATFDAAADGYVRAEGGGLFALMRLEDAQRSGAPILAVIRGTAINHDGRSNGLTAPNGDAQRAVLKEALEDAGLLPAQIDAVECHGTGTPLGDPIEVQALAEVYGEGRDAAHPLQLMAVKARIGHVEAAAGAAGMLEAVLSLQHGVLIPVAGLQTLNPALDWAGLPVRPVRRDTSQGSTRPRYIGVSSFGISGTNAHLILEDAPAEPDRSREISTVAAPLSPLAFPLSGQTRAALRAQAGKLRVHLEARPDLQLMDVAWSLANTRTHFEHRAVVVAADRGRLLEGLTTLSKGRIDPAVVEGEARIEGRVAFVFPGQGSQWPSMARALLETSTVFRDQVLACERALAPHLDWSLVAVLRGEESASSLERVDVVQPALFAVMVSLAALWRAMGIEPDAVIGHSQGEVAAACVAGALSLEDAARVVALRSQALVRLEGRGGMGVIELPVRALARWLAPYGAQLSVAAINSPTSSLVSGAPEAIEALVEQLSAAQVFARRVQVGYASHCAQVEAIREELLERLKDIRPIQATIPLYSTVIPGRLDGVELDADYWYRNLRQPVRFSEAVSLMLKDEYRFLVEISPQPVLTLALQTTLESVGISGVVVPSLRREEGGLERFLLAVGALHTHGLKLDWSRIIPPGQRIVLPTYAFQRERFSIEAPDPRRAATASTTRALPDGGHPLLGTAFSMSFPTGVVFWERALSVTQMPWLQDHRLASAIVFPASGYVEMGLEAGRQALPGRTVMLEAVAFKQALILSNSEPCRIQMSLAEDGAGAWRWQIAQGVEGEGTPATVWHELASGRAVLDPTDRSAESASLEQSKRCYELEQTASSIYDGLERMGVVYGPAFRGLNRLWRSRERGGALGRVMLPTAAGAAGSYTIPPTLLDACFQVAVATADDVDQGGPMVQAGIERVQLWHPPKAGPVWCEAVRRRGNAAGLVTDLTLWNEEGLLLGRIAGLHATPLEQVPGEAEDPLAQALLSVTWLEIDPIEPPADVAWLERRPVSSEGRFLVLADRQGAAASVVSRLEARGVQVEVVSSDGGSGGVDPGDRVAVGRMIEKALQGPVPLRGVLCLWGLDSPGMEALDPPRLLEAGQSGWAGALHVAQALTARVLRDPPRLVLATWRAQSPAGIEPVRPEQALLWGLGGTIRTEHGSLRPLRVDLGNPRSAGELEALVGLALSDTDEDQVCLREGRQLVARLERHPLPPVARQRTGVQSQESSEAEISVPVMADAGLVKREATYLITGGLGGLGLSVADWLTRQGAGHLVLVNLSGMATESQHHAVDSMRARGTQVTVAALDVSDGTALSRLVDSIPDGYPLRGVVHAAGVLEDALVADQSVASFRKVMGPKVAGAWHLHRLTAGLELDFFVLYSSAAGLLGSPGQSNYAAANCFLDALAHHRRHLGLPALSLDWGAFAEVGMAVAQENRGARLAGRGMRLLSLEDGRALFGQLVGSALIQVAPCPLDIGQWVEFYPETSGWPYLEKLRAEGSGGGGGVDQGWLEALNAVPPEEARRMITTHVLEQLGLVLRVDPGKLTPTTPFKTMGLDSLMGLELRNRLQSTTGQALPATAIWTYPTAAALAGVISAGIRQNPQNITASSSNSDTGSPAVPVERALRHLEADLQDISDEELLKLGEELLS